MGNKLFNKDCMTHTVLLSRYIIKLRIHLDTNYMTISKDIMIINRNLSNINIPQTLSDLESIRTADYNS